MKIYLASRFSRIREMREYAIRLEDLGHIITSSWVFRPARNVENLHGKSAGPTAELDVADVLAADTVIGFTEPPRSTSSRGGRHVEFGVGIGTGRHRLIVIGGRENVFHALPQIEHYETFADLDRELTAKRDQQAMQMAA